MIKNIKIHNILDNIETSKTLELNKCTFKKFFMKVFIWVFLMIFQSSRSNKIKVHDVPSDTTQGWVYLSTNVVNVIKLNMCIIICSINIHLMKLVVQWLMTWFLNVEVRSWIPHIFNFSHYHSPKWRLAH